MEDASVPKAIRNDLIEAMRGNKSKQDYITYEDLKFKYDIFENINGDKAISQNECYFNVGSV